MEVSRPSRESFSGPRVVVLSRTGDKTVLCSGGGEPGTLGTFSSPVLVLNCCDELAMERIVC
ncbi:hypothetical protein L195_g064195 [Trifolium pratense]|uniref:Uncharacterized protein n=1 Tax=Trifolium pratense TaxID=57577 RepID=A0A2K3KRK0_TRIPR|nr:hypothetical protein L195_g064195 [Trifolium pratense]